jgi:hypothetical protein
MLKFILKNGWLTAAFLLLTPVSLIFFIGIQSALGQVTGQFAAYQNIPQATQLVQLSHLPAGAVVLVRGQIEGSAGTDLLIYQEHPVPGQETAYQEPFAQIFPQFGLTLPDGSLPILPSQSRERVIQHELHTVPAGDKLQAGFKAGDTVMVMGQWQPGPAASLIEVTGITSLDKDQYLAEWQTDFQKIEWLRNGLGLITLLGLIVLVMQWRRAKTNPPSAEGEVWPTQTQETAPTASQS